MVPKTNRKSIALIDVYIYTEDATKECRISGTNYLCIGLWSALVTEERITSFSDYEAYIRNSCKRCHLFRGVSDASYRLIPKIGRRAYVSKFSGAPDEVLDSLQDLEEKTITRFVSMSVPYTDLRNMSSWDQWSIGQHHGLPTRFLDWTENPLIAAYFAVEDTSGNDAAIYIINREQFSSSSDFDDPLSGTDDILLHLPSYINPRIIAQKGVFTVHKDPTKPLDETTVSGVLCNTIKLLLVQSCHDEFIECLDWYGINKSFIYPGLDGLAGYLDFQARK